MNDPQQSYSQNFQPSNKTLWIILSVLIGLPTVLLAGCVACVMLVGFPPVREPDAVRRDPKRAVDAASPKESTRRNAIPERNSLEAAASFRKKVMSLPEGRQLISSIEQATVPGVLNIHVTNAWFSGETYQKRQLTTRFLTLWQQEMGTSNVVLHIYDTTGHEVAGSSVLGGIWIEDD